jgi:hypothetical protein
MVHPNNTSLESGRKEILRFIHDLNYPGLQAGVSDG